MLESTTAVAPDVGSDMGILLIVVRPPGVNVCPRTTSPEFVGLGTALAPEAGTGVGLKIAVLVPMTIDEPDAGSKMRMP